MNAICDDEDVKAISFVGSNTVGNVFKVLFLEGYDTSVGAVLLDFYSRKIVLFLWTLT